MRVYDRRGALAWVAFMVLLAFMLGAGYFVTHADTNAQVAEANRKAAVAACESLRTSRTTLRTVIRLATEPSTTVLIPNLTADPVLGQDFTDAIKRVLGQLSAPVADTKLRDTLLSQAPRLRCTHDGVPIESR